ncbi:MAG: response regulator [Bacteroidia bacterium]|nr:response regulator [Bacteroidia bacterium]
MTSTLQIRYVFLLGLCLIFLFPEKAWTQSQGIRYVIRHIDTEGGLLHTDAPSVTQDRNGYMWFATLSGLQRFDGFEYQTFLNNTDPFNRVYYNRIRQLRFDQQGRLWMVTYNGVACFEPWRETFISPQLEEGLSPDILREARNIHIDGKNRMMISSATETWIFQIQENGTLATTIGNPKGAPAIKHPTVDFVTDSQGNLWLGGKHEIWMLPVNASFTEIQSLKTTILSEDHQPNYFHRLAIDQENGLLFSGQQTFYRIDLTKLNRNTPISSLSIEDLQLSQTVELSHPDEVIPQWEINALTVDSDNNCWLATTKGLIRYPISKEKKGEFQTFQHSEMDLSSLSSNHVASLFIDKAGILWMGTWGGGVNMLNLGQKKFYLLRNNPSNPEAGISGPFVRAVVEDSKRKQLWVGTRENGLTLYDQQTGRFEAFKHKQNDPSSLINDYIRSLALDQDDKLWVGTDRGLGYLDLNTKKFHEPFQNFPVLRVINSFGLGVDHTGQIWAGGWQGDGLFRIRMNGDEVQEVVQVSNIKGIQLSNSNITFIKVDQERGEVWVSTQEGLNQLILDKVGNPVELRTYVVHPGELASLNSNFIWPTLRENDSVVWVGTLGGGLNKMILTFPYVQGKMNYKAEHYDVSSGAPFNDIETMLQDESGNLWLGGRGLAKFMPDQKEFLLYEKNDGLQGNSFKIGAANKGSDGCMYFGGTNGLNFFYPDQITANGKNIPTSIARLTVNNRAIEVGKSYDNQIILSQTINQLDELVLNHQFTSFTLHFASLHFSNPEKCKFRYRLVGYDENWVYVGADAPFANYSNLDYGTYTFELAASNSDGIWSHDIDQLQIRIVPPWYATWWAKVTYFLLLGSLIFLVFTYLRRWERMKRDLELTHLHERQKEEMHQMRIQFFTNISHEFRTPLSLILSPLERIVEENLGKMELKRHIRLISDNANRLLRLVNELLDLRKLESGQAKLRISEMPMTDFVYSVAERFEELAASKAIDYEIEVTDSEEAGCYDRDILENILYNLLSNAFKYTAVGGTVKLIASFDPIPNSSFQYPNTFAVGKRAESKRNLFLRVEDSGVGVSGASIEHLFDRYYRVSESPQDQHLGSGIGLALVKSLVTLHRGDIEVMSQRGHGTQFTITLPLDKICYQPEELINGTAMANRFHQPEPLVETAQLPVLNQEDGKGMLPKILLVEDNGPVRQYLIECLRDTYELFEAENGKIALEKIHQVKPDIILSDIMMPEMDGIELCRAVKSDETLAHIPFVLLTAKTSEDSQVDCITAGADLYFSKPFNLKLIKLNLANLISQQNRLLKRQISSAFTEQHQKATNARDKELFDQVVTIIDQHLDNTDFAVQTLCRAVGMSRTNLYAKMKEISGHTIGEFIRKRRLHHAAIALSEGDMSVLEVMDKVGIRSQSYFTRAFKKEFGKTPSQFIQEIGHQQKPEPAHQKS